MVHRKILSNKRSFALEKLLFIRKKNPEIEEFTALHFNINFAKLSQHPTETLNKISAAFENYLSLKGAEK